MLHLRNRQMCSARRVSCAGAVLLVCKAGLLSPEDSLDELPESMHGGMAFPLQGDSALPARKLPDGSSLVEEFGTDHHEEGTAHEVVEVSHEAS